MEVLVQVFFSSSSVGHEFSDALPLASR